MSRATVLVILAALVPMAAPGRDDSPAAAPGVRRALLICGLPGDDEHRALYADAVLSLHASLMGRYGFPASEIRVRFGAEDGKAPSVSRGPSDRPGIESEVAELRRKLGTDDTLWVIVLGHCHYDGR